MRQHDGLTGLPCDTMALIQLRTDSSFPPRNSSCLLPCNQNMQDYVLGNMQEKGHSSKATMCTKTRKDSTSLQQNLKKLERGCPAGLYM